MKVLVTGASGFIGKNLCENLKRFPEHTIYKYDKENTREELSEFILSSDIIFHLAGVNRPENVKEFQEGNADLTGDLIKILESNNKQTPLVVSSSIQSSLDNPYGQSKKAAERFVLDWAKRTKSKAYVFRFPNVFGKWSRPNYNSAVATFCHNVAHDIPLRIDEPKAKLNLVYIDDVIDSFLKIIGGQFEVAQDGFSYVEPIYNTSVGEIAEIISSFAKIRSTKVLPEFSNSLVLCLFSTYLSFLDTKDLIYDLTGHSDNRGRLAEFVRTKHNGQITVSYTAPGGEVRGGHWHNTKIEKFVVLHGQAQISLRLLGTSDIITFDVDGSKLQVIDIPPGYTHSVNNIGTNELILMYWANQNFDPEHPDTYKEGL